MESDASVIERFDAGDDESSSRSPSRSGTHDESPETTGNDTSETDGVSHHDATTTRKDTSTSDAPTGLSTDADPLTGTHVDTAGSEDADETSRNVVETDTSTNVPTTAPVSNETTGAQTTAPPTTQTTSTQTTNASTEVLLARGQSCQEDDQCVTGICKDGYCCNTACDGQCESCGVPGNRGTCLPVTTPRTACGGTGPCAGYCTGTEQYRHSCVFPGAETTCGDEASCANSVATSAERCDGEGACETGVEQSCTYGCKGDGTACASTCPSGQDLCGGSCVDTDSNSDFCGSECRQCDGDRPICFEGECVECGVSGDCDQEGTTCKSDNTCGCSVGNHACGASRTPCYSDSDVTHCGSDCLDCRQPNATAECGSDNLCANQCNSDAYLLACPAVGGKPNCSQWLFESDDPLELEGWEVETLTALSGAVHTSTVNPFSGEKALAIPVDNGNGESGLYVSIRVQLCAGSNVLALSGKHIRWAFRMDPPQTGGYNYVQVYDAAGFNFAGGVYDFNTDDDGLWDRYDYELYEPTFDRVFGIGFHLEATDPYVGTFYLDDIAIY